MSHFWVDVSHVIELPLGFALNLVKWPNQKLKIFDEKSSYHFQHNYIQSSAYANNGTYFLTSFDLLKIELKINVEPNGSRDTVSKNIFQVRDDVRTLARRYIGIMIKEGVAARDITNFGLSVLGHFTAISKIASRIMYLFWFRAGTAGSEIYFKSLQSFLPSTKLSFKDVKYQKVRECSILSNLL